MTGDMVLRVSAMLRGALGDRLATDLGSDATFRDLFAEDGVMEFPLLHPASRPASMDAQHWRHTWTLSVGRSSSGRCRSRSSMRPATRPW